MPTNYVEIDQRYEWLAGLFSLTLHAPSGATKTLGSGGATDPGALFFNTEDNTLNVWNGTSWITLGIIPSFQQNGVVIGGTRTWIEDYDFEIAESYYYINSILYHSPRTTVTLDPSDPTDDRIDLFVLTTSNTAEKITGVAGTPPAEPNYDPATQLNIGFALVENGTTEPTVTQDFLYRENAGTPTEWAYTDNSANLNPASTNNPYAGTIDIEGTTVGAGDSFTLTDTASPNFSLYDALIFKIRSKAAWSTRNLSIRFFNGTTALGNTVLFGNGSFGFDSSNVSTYQNINIPISTFGAIAGADRVTFRRMTGGGTIGFYIDEIQLMLSNSIPPSSTPTQQLANTSDATSHTISLTGSSTSVKIVEGSGITLTTTGTGNNAILTIASTGGGIDSVLAIAQALTAARSISLNNFAFDVKQGSDNLLHIDDAAEAVVVGKVVAGGTYLDLNAGADIITMQAGTSSYVEFDHASKLFHVVTDGGFNFLNLDAINGIYQIGDTAAGASGNNTYLEVNDATQAVKITNVQEFADNAAAITGGLSTGMIYRTGDDLKIVH